MSHPTLGLDIAKDSFDAVLLGPEPRSRHRRFANSPAGFSALQAWLEKQGVVLPEGYACMEATGAYFLALATFLHALGMVVYVVNPARIKGYAIAQGLRTKNDKVDAACIAAFAQKPPRTLRAWEPSAPELSRLLQLTRRLGQLERMRQQERNRLAAPGLDPFVQASGQRMRAVYEEELARVTAEIEALFRDHSHLAQERHLLETIPGIGAKTAAVLLAELRGLPFTQARQVAAYAGVVPRESRSGTTMYARPRLSKQGSTYLRAALYWPAIVAIRVDSPQLRHLVEGMRARGKTKMQIICAVMRKLLHTAFGVLHSGRPFDPTHHLRKRA